MINIFKIKLLTVESVFFSLLLGNETKKWAQKKLEKQIDKICLWAGEGGGGGVIFNYNQLKFWFN